MAENNVSQWNRQDQSFEGVDWEEESYREGCAYARERASVRLKELDDRYELVGKRMYGHASERMGFWEGASLEWGKHYDLGRVRLFVVGGDGANRIRSGVGEFGDAVFQLDSLHLSRAYGAELGSAIYEAIRSG